MADTGRSRKTRSDKGGSHAPGAGRPPQTRKVVRLGFRRARVKAGLSYDDVAEAVSRNYQTVNHWEHGRATPGPKEMLILADILEVPLKRVVTWFTRKRKDVVKT